jgi:hypothetical protein
MPWYGIIFDNMLKHITSCLQANFTSFLNSLPEKLGCCVGAEPMVNKVGLHNQSIQDYEPAFAHSSQEAVFIFIFSVIPPSMI